MMKKKKFCLAGTILALAVLSGCGMARDGYIQDRPSSPLPTVAPMESPYISASPMPTQTPSDNQKTDMNTPQETPAPEQKQTEETR